MNIGYIYKITNNVNSKCYIGQTSKTIEDRWKEHIKTSQNEKREGYNYPLYKAFRKYGIENFSIDEIEECDISELNDREMYWIKYYDSYHNGYNQTLGGSGGKYLELDENEVIKKYSELKNASNTAKYFNCSSSTIKDILEKHNIDIISSKYVSRETSIIITQKDLQGNILNTFNGRTEIGNWIVENNLMDTKNPAVAGERFCAKFYFHKYFEKWNYIWSCNKTFDFEKNKEKARASFKKNFYRHKQSSKTKCPICEKIMELNSSCCLYCENEKRKQLAIQNREQKYNVTREILKEQIRTMSFLQIGKLYGVSDTMIRKWCKSYNLPYKASEIKKYTDEEWKEI